MSAVIAGAASGLLMASVFVAVGALMLFPYVKDPPPRFRLLMERFSPSKIVMSTVIFSYPVWAVVGAVAGLLYKASQDSSGTGLGSPNLAFTLSVLVLAAMIAVPLGLLLRRVAAGVAAMTVVFAGVFGWLMPLLAG